VIARVLGDNMSFGRAAAGQAAAAFILRTHPAATIYLDRDSASLLTPGTLSELAAPA